MTVTLHGVCWDRPGCTRPTAGSRLRYRVKHLEILVSCEARPLGLFNDQPVWEVKAGYDLVCVDHPMTRADAQWEALVARADGQRTTGVVQ